MSGVPHVRDAYAADVPALFRMVNELAEYERLAHEVRATETQLRDAMFGARRYADCAVGSG